MSPWGALRRSFELDWFVLALVFAWKLALLAFTAQPVPAGDAFFYDGPVVNYLSGGGYCNPTIALVLPISGNVVFSAYPPLYQGVLWAWMSLFGTSALSASWLHLVLFGFYSLAVLSIFRQARVSALWVNLGCLFFLANTFHDRPDTLAFALGTWAIYAWNRSRQQNANWRGNVWSWSASLLAVLTICTSLQIGLAFIFWSGLLLLMMEMGRMRTLPWLPVVTALLVPVALVLLVRNGYPRLWQGFMEHVGQSPTLAGWKAPGAVALFKSYVLKALRTVPGVAYVAVFVALFTMIRRQGAKAWLTSEAGRLMLVSLATAMLLVSTALCSLTPNPVLWAAYPQPLVVGLFGASLGTMVFTERQRWMCTWIFLPLAVVGAVRAIGMTTWGVICAMDVGYGAAVRLVRSSLADSPPASPVTLSSAYLYEAVSHGRPRVIHSDWMAPYRQESDFISNLVGSVIGQKPTKLVLTQFDYFRRYEAVIEGLKLQPGLVEVTVTNTATVRSPDSYRSMQKLVQHVSWAPVIVELSWK